MLTALFVLACIDAPAPKDTAASVDDPPSGGCGLPSDTPAGGVQRTLDAGAAGGGERGYGLSLPEGYDPDRAHPIVLGFPGTNWVGEQIQPYLDLERHATEPAIFVYPDPQWHTFDGWGELGGWLLGPHAAPADGDADLVFVDTLIETLAEEHCVDLDRVYVTGHSWGGDMAAVMACFLGDRVTAAAPIAANEPYWFRPADGGSPACQGHPAVWTFFGEADDHFTWQDYPGEFGDAQDAFWAERNACGDATADLDVGISGDCVAHEGCVADTRYCLYGPETAHQAPTGFGEVVMSWFELVSPPR
jgi:polyhydroxybutyrate depolymerase